MNNNDNLKPLVSRRAGARALAAVLASHVLLIACGPASTVGEGGGPSSSEGGAPRAPTTTYGERDGVPTMTFSDGTRVVLDRLDVRDALRAQFPSPPETAPEDGESSAEVPEQGFGTKGARPVRVDLRDRQTPIRNQGGRGTCVAHATVAALEAAYLRERSLMLDLSEQYANHVQKMTALPAAPTGFGQRETQLGAWGGSSLRYQLGWLFRLRFGLPEETIMEGIVPASPDLTYIPWADYENTDQDGDIPRMDWQDPLLRQSDVDAWNLNSEPVAYSIRRNVTLVNFPREAPAEAVYGAARAREIRPTLAAIRDELAAGREVAIGFDMTTNCLDSAGNFLPEGDPCYVAEKAEQFDDGVWHSLETVWAGHAMLIVGYDDEKEAFIVKNSWGTGPDDDGRGRPVEAAVATSGFIYFSYDQVDRIGEAYSVLETRDPSSWLNQQPYLGLWHVEADASPRLRSDFAVYHLPGAFPSSALSGQIDRRIGTLYASDGFGVVRPLRVNGSLGPNKMRAYFDSFEINQSYDATGGSAIEVVALRVDDDTLAGWTSRHDPDVREPFFATLGDYPAMQFAREEASNPAPIDFFGSWRIVGAGLDGVIEFADSIVDGTYTPSDSGSAIAGVELEINPRMFITDPDDPCFVRITVPAARSVTLDGLLFCETSTPTLRALITGIGDETGVGDERGFYAYRERRDPAVVIQTPSNGSAVPRGRQRVYFRARTIGFTEAPVIRWTSDLDGFIGESAESFSRVDLSFGTHVITASTTAPDGGTVSDSVELTISNDPPTVDIVEPSGVERYCVDEPITFLATSRDLNNTPTFELPESAIEWSVAGGAFVGMGHSVTSSFPEGDYTIVVRATDDEGAFAEDSVDLRVETCVDNNPPTASILRPAVDSGVNDAQYAYDGYDDARGQWYTDVTFVGTGTDPEDGSLSGSSLVWTTNRTDVQSGTLGTGGTVTARLYSDTCFGTWHDVELTVTDSGGKPRSAMRRIFIWTLC